jgi:hypothetical protein
LVYLYYTDKAIKAGGKIFADTSIICKHWDMNTGLPTSLEPGSMPLRRAATKKVGQKKIVDLGCGENAYKTEESDVLTVELRLVLPNIEWAADRIKEGVIDDNVLNVLYGAQTYGENFHQFGFTPETLSKIHLGGGPSRVAAFDWYSQLQYRVSPG